MLSPECPPRWRSRRRYRSGERHPGRVPRAGRARHARRRARTRRKVAPARVLAGFTPRGAFATVDAILARALVLSSAARRVRSPSDVHLHPVMRVRRGGASRACAAILKAAAAISAGSREPTRSSTSARYGSSWPPSRMASTSSRKAAAAATRHPPASAGAAAPDCGGCPARSAVAGGARGASPASSPGRAPGAPGAPDAVHVGFGVQRQVVVDDMADFRDIQPARGHIGRHQHLRAPGAEAFEHALALRLGDLAVDRLRHDSRGRKAARTPSRRRAAC